MTFKAKGGQIGEESEIRRQIFVRFGQASAKEPPAKGQFFSRNLPNESKDRIDVAASGERDGRRVTLVRCFDLELRAGFEVTQEPSPLTLAPGESGIFKLRATRLPPFVGPIAIEPTEVFGIKLPEKLEIPAGKDEIDVPVSVAADFMPRRVQIRFQSSAQVGQFLEEPRPKNIDIDVKKPTPPPAAKPEAKK